MAEMAEPVRAVAVLRAVVEWHPDDVWVNYNLARLLGRLRPAPREEMVRYYSAARALRPETAHELAHLLDEMGRSDDAIRVFADLASRRPDDGRNLACYARCLQQRGRPEAAAVTEQAIRACNETIRLKPNDAWAYNNRGIILCDVKKEYAEAKKMFCEAIRLKPDYAGAYISLGHTLYSQGEVARVQVARVWFGEAEAAYRKAIALNSGYAEAHYNLGNALYKQRRLGEAEAAYREVVALKPDHAMAQYCLGNTLIEQGRRGEAEIACREAVALKPDHAEAHNNLGIVRDDQGRFGEAEAAYRKAIALKPGYAEAHYNLGMTLENRGRLGEAEAAYRKAIALKPDFAQAYCNLASILLNRGDYATSFDMYRTGHELGTKQPDWCYPSEQWVANAKRQAALAQRLPALLKGEDRPRDVAERLDLARMCNGKKYYAAAARFWSEALEADPELGNDRRSEHRYQAACAAVLAAAGQGVDQPPLDDAAKARLRGQAFEWLEAERNAWVKHLNGGGQGARAELNHRLRHWQLGPELAAVRDPDALADLPEPERTRWYSLWASIYGLERRTQRAPIEPHDPRAVGFPVDPFAVAR
jgi:tetratricopeptide (TPR) repeat protein